MIFYGQDFRKDLAGDCSAPWQSSHRGHWWYSASGCAGLEGPRQRYSPICLGPWGDGCGLDAPRWDWDQRHVASPDDSLRVFALLMQLLRLTKTVPRAQGRRCRASNGTLLTVTKPHFSCNLCIRQIISVQLRFKGRHRPSMREAAQILQSSFIYHEGQWLICVCTATRRQASGWTRGYGLSATSLYSFEGQKLTF